MVQPLMSFDDIGKKRTGPHVGGIRQKYVLDEPGRRLIFARYDGTTPTINELAERLCVPRWTVKKWAGEMGLTRQKEPPWTQTEMDYLEKFLHRKSMADIAKKLGRTKMAVKLKAKRLGVNKCYQEGYTMHGLQLALGCDHKKIRQWVEHGWLKGSRRGTERHGAQKGDVWLFTDRAVRKFIIAHPNEIDVRRADWLWLVDVLAGGIGALDTDRGEQEG